MAKQANEFNSLLGVVVNSGYKIMEDGKIALDDLSTIFPLIIEAERGFNGMKEYPAEMAVATIQEKNELKATFEKKLTDVPAQDAYDLAAGAHGIQALLSYAFRRGVAAGEEATILKIKSGTLKI